MPDREFKGVWIPKDVWLDDRLNMLEKGILIEIDSLDRSEDGCWAGNEYLANFCQCSPWKVSNAVSKLIQLGYIKMVAFDGRNRKLKSCLSYFQRQTFENQKAATGISKDSNTREKNKKVSISRSRDDADSSLSFDTFYAAYPRKVSKPAAIKAWAKLKPDETLLQTILNDISRRKRGEWAGKDMQYIPHPATYINQRRWEDDTAARVEEEVEHDLSVEEIMRRGEDCSMPEGYTPCGGW